MSHVSVVTTDGRGGGGSCSGRMPRFSFMGRDADLLCLYMPTQADDVASFPASSE